MTEKISDLVWGGMTSVPDLAKCLKIYVEDVLFLNKDPPPKSSRAFYPTQSDIANHVLRTLRKDRCSLSDQANALQLVTQLKEKDPSANVFFLPYKSRDIPEQDQHNVTDDVLDAVAAQCVDTLLFCYQSKFMRELMDKYSHRVTCLDATYKTTDYSIPLFFMVVKTSVNYMITGAFAVQFETADSIREALSIFKSWCSSWNPKFFMVDYSKAEINSILLEFPETQIALCDFHREQSWKRWCDLKSKDVEDKQRVLTLLRCISNTLSEEEYEEALKSLKESPEWQQNEKLQRYMSQHWLSVSQWWVKCYRVGLHVNTNNGTETQNRLLKEHYLKHKESR